MRKGNIIKFQILQQTAGGCPTITISPSSISDLTAGQATTINLSSTGGTAPYTYTVTSGSLPTGLTLNGGTGVISGTPTTTGAASFQITSTDANSCTGVQSYSFNVNYEADAQAFITAAAITNTTQQQAINTLVVSLKGYGIWSKMKAIYPFVGGTASTHKWNLKDPRDLDAAFRLVFSGGWTHNSLGLTQGANGYADTKINPFGFTANDVHFSLYQRLNTTSGNDCFGARNGTGTESIRWIVKAAATTTSYLDINGDVNRITTTVADSRGLFIASRINSTSLKAYRNNTILATRTNTNTGGNPNYNLYLGALNQTNSANNYSAQNFAFLSFGDGLTDTEASNLYTLVQTYQTALNRQV